MYSSRDLLSDTQQRGQVRQQAQTVAGKVEEEEEAEKIREKQHQFPAQNAYIRYLICDNYAQVNVVGQLEERSQELHLVVEQPFLLFRTRRLVGGVLFVLFHEGIAQAAPPLFALVDWTL